MHACLAITSGICSPLDIVKLPTWVACGNLMSSLLSMELSWRLRNDLVSFQKLCLYVWLDKMRNLVNFTLTGVLIFLFWVMTLLKLRNLANLLLFQEWGTHWNYNCMAEKYLNVFTLQQLSPWLLYLLCQVFYCWYSCSRILV